MIETEEVSKPGEGTFKSNESRQILKTDVNYCYFIMVPPLANIPII